MNPTKALVSPVRAETLASGVIASAAWQNECHPAGRVLSSGFPLTLTLPSGKQMILMRDSSLSPGTQQAHTGPIVLHCPCCSLEITNTAHHVNVHTVTDKERYTTRRGRFKSSIRIFDALS